MGDIQILDCTLRDGGRIIDCAFKDNIIIGIGRQLNKSGINIIEAGFLRDFPVFAGNSTFFSVCNDADMYIQKMRINDKKNTKYTLFVDFGLYDLTKLPSSDKTEVTGIRYGFTKRDFRTSSAELKQEMLWIKESGYDLYLQDVNTNGYSEEELKELIGFANEIRPLSFGIVDTYGSMYLDDLEKAWDIVDKFLNKEIAVDFHSHNNMQMSFALCQRLLHLAQESRPLIIDATLAGMGKCAGNLNTELILDYMSRKLSYDYDVDAVLDAIDRYLYAYQKKPGWGYSIPAFLAGIFRAHPNNVIYLTEKYRLNSRDIKYILSGIEETKRQRYDYDDIVRVYKKYCASKIDDWNTIEFLSQYFAGKEVVVLAPGSSVRTEKQQVINYIARKKPIVVSINFIPDGYRCNFYFFANTIHWEKVQDMVSKKQCILTSNIHVLTEGTYQVDYSRLIVEENPYGDNSTIMLLYLLKILGVKKISLAGFDGLKKEETNYVNDSFPNSMEVAEYEKINQEIAKLFHQFHEKVKDKIIVNFLTSSLYGE